MSVVSLLFLLTAAYSWAPIKYQHSLANLSVARRNIGAVSADGVAYFAGGCNNEGGGMTQFICDSASDVVDVLDENGRLIKVMHLTEARGWVSACASGETVVFAGGGKSGTKPHSRRADILNITSMAMRSVPDALTNGRWGVACAAAGDHIYYIGGKVVVSGYSDAWTSPLIDVFSTEDGTWFRSPYNLSEDKESAVAVGTTDGHIVIAGGWRKGKSFVATSVIETLTSPTAPAGGSVLSSMKTAAYDVGMTLMDDGVLIVGNENLHRVDTSGEVKSIALPAALSGAPSGLVGGGPIPATHMPQNGVTIGHYACFYASSPSAVYCYDTRTAKWSMLQCSVPHAGGAIVKLGSSILIAGGFDPSSPVAQATSTVDIFKLDGF